MHNATRWIWSLKVKQLVSGKPGAIHHMMVDHAEFNGYDLRNGANSTDIVFEA